MTSCRAALGEFYRRMRAKLGAPKAITAAAHKLARIIYHMMKTREPYDESVFARLEIRYRQRIENRLKAPGTRQAVFGGTDSRRSSLHEK